MAHRELATDEEVTKCGKLPPNLRHFGTCGVCRRRFDEKVTEPLRSNEAKINFGSWLTTAARTIACFEGADGAKMRAPVVGGNRLLMVTQL